MIKRVEHPVAVRQLNSLCFVLEQHFAPVRSVTTDDFEDARKHFDVDTVLTNMHLDPIQERKLYAAAAARFQLSGKVLTEKLEDREYVLYVTNNEPGILDLEGIEVPLDLNLEIARGSMYVNLQAAQGEKKLLVATRGLTKGTWVYLAGVYDNNICAIGLEIKLKS